MISRAKVDKPTTAHRRSSVFAALVLVSLSFPVYYSHALIVPSQSSRSPSQMLSMSMKLANGHDDEMTSRSKRDNQIEATTQDRTRNNGFAATVASIALAMSLCFVPFTSEPAHASGYSSLSPEQKFVAEAWREVDATFLDRTFNGQDWYQMRQALVKTKYQSMDDAHDAVGAMMSKLGDKYTRYLTPAKYQSMVDAATGTLAGIGVEIATNKELLPIVSDVEPNSPAQKAGLLPKDVFLEGGGAKFDKTSTPDDVATRLRGPVGSKVGVTVLRDGTTTEDFIIVRQPIKVSSVRSYIAESDKQVGVIRIKSFSGTTGATVKEQFEDLKKKGAKTILMDLRSNPGGLLPGGVETASLFLEANKPVVYVVSNKGVISAEETFQDGFDTETKLTILVDHNTASAAEVFTAAMKENGRAKVIGEQTFGKGIIQTIRQLSDGNGGVAVTVARYETPKHNDINKSGIAVDQSVDVECPKTDALACLPAGML